MSNSGYGNDAQTQLKQNYLIFVELVVMQNSELYGCKNGMRGENNYEQNF